jgi:chromosomal replication initiation ATPase DnaA
VFSTNLDEKDLADQAFLRRMGYRARVEPPTPGAYTAIFKHQAGRRGITVEQPVLDHILTKYRVEHRQMKGCEPRDLLDRATDICLFENKSLKLTPQIVDIAWRNYFGTAHSFAAAEPPDPLEL